MATLGKSVENYIKTLGVTVDKLHPTVGESIRALGEAKGVDTTGTPAEILEAVADSDSEGDSDGGEGDGGDGGEADGGESEESISDEDAVLSYLNSFDADVVLTDVASMLASYPSSGATGLSWVTNMWDATGNCQMLFNVSNWAINNDGMYASGLLNVMLTGTIDGETMTITGYRLYSASVTFGGGSKTVAVTSLDVSGTISQSFTATQSGINVGSITGYEGAEFGTVTSGSFKVGDTEYTIGE